jgi:hypothetical protein
MEKIQQLELMDKIQRELEDLANSQTAVLKKLSQIEAHNITLGVGLLDDKLPDLHEEINSSVTIVSELVEAFAAHRENFFTSNKGVLQSDPTA